MFGDVDPDDHAFWSARVEEALEAVFDRVIDAALSVYDKTAVALTAAGTDPIGAVDVDQMFDPDFWARTVDEDFGPVFTTAIEAEGAAAAARLGVAFDVRNPFTQQVADRHLAALKGYSGSIRTHITNQIERGLAQGHSVDKVRKNLLRGPFSEGGEVAARRIAQTELIAAQNGAAVELYNLVDNVTKTWRSTSDDLTRDTHVNANGQAVEGKAEFQVGGYFCQYPGDPALPAEERLNCRCRVTASRPAITASGDPAGSREEAVMADETTEATTALATGGIVTAPAAGLESGTELLIPHGQNQTITTVGIDTNHTNVFVDTGTAGQAVAFETDDNDDDGESVGEFGTDPNRPFEWEGVLTIEGSESGDQRFIAEGALTWRDLPIPLMFSRKNEGGHFGSEPAGAIVEIERDGTDIVGRGWFDTGEAGTELKRMIDEGTLRGVSVDLDLVTVDEESMDEWFDGEGPLVITEARIMGATGTPFPAFQEAFLKLIENDEALVASGARLFPSHDPGVVARLQSLGVR